MSHRIIVSIEIPDKLYHHIKKELADKPMRKDGSFPDGKGFGRFILDNSYLKRFDEDDSFIEFLRLHQMECGF